MPFTHEKEPDLLPGRVSGSIWSNRSRGWWLLVSVFFAALLLLLGTGIARWVSSAAPSEAAVTEVTDEGWGVGDPAAPTTGDTPGTDGPRYIDDTEPLPDTVVPVDTTSCGMFPYDPATETPDLLSPPAGEWRNVGGVLAPYNPEIGPVDGPEGGCYAHSPAGALFAVVNFLALMADPALTPTAKADLSETLMASGPRKEQVLTIWRQQAVRETSDIPADAGASTSTAAPVIIGFHFIGYSGDLAILDLAYAVDGVTLTTTYQARFEAGSWMFDPPAGKYPTRATPEIDPAYFTLWSPR